MEGSIWSLIPPLLALVMVILTRRVLLSLGIGIIVGAIMLNDFAILESIKHVAELVGAIFVTEGAINDWELFIIFFLLLLGMMAALMTRSGGTRAFGEWAVRKVKTRVGAQLLAFWLGIIVFIDDYFNSLTVGNVSRPLTDRHRVSRAKLAYIVDSTSAPICVISPISSWGAYIITIIAGILATHGVTQYGGLQAFVMMVPMNLYAIVAIGLVFAVAWYNLDVGAMKIHETKAVETGELLDAAKGPAPGEQDQVKVVKQGRVSDLILPIVALVIGTVTFMITTGIQGTEGTVTILSIFENTDVARALVYGGLIGFIVALVLNLVKGANGLGGSLWAGIKSMLPAIYILIFAWTLIGIIDGLGTGGYLASLVDGRIPPMLLPAILFLIAGVTAFSTGTSWGTFGILLPIAGEMAAVIDVTMILPMLAAVLAGAIFGDHCSPISDTTILSSTGAGSHHIDHVITQLPYAILSAVISFIAFLALGMTNSVLIGLAVAIGLLVLSVIILKRIAADKQPVSS
ncbi:Na+/H+ antiporter NhaC family protein [Halalkalibacterium halodurans]|jgi:tetracycline resistance efflux pump|uniref:Sodium:proton antiporter n=1 Tax=Halalkalibacterium halodurans TaxID=86665 RepID=A0A0M0KGA4_ALKHA|nr:Na+/H+ antiporter NhaC family protein [Halalkalibacterium halodurans]MED3645297.1 Na+/H+ antiporter NhaC family protein [Halalkalibacterium halodurans]MED4080135.1 Na+/H+ antiporter NhaC family protein [Halalkalibacterium halodurans]MED4083358.1 Na+/H+ antiporter NhaC family protein [Halalkalibacterium halodurans]MED4105100.1 Na+/H+ antiporter NhaC family protein [Halalkalibacterium halodurans]MED4109418.1 Na+/H+ antiporter NhaC family protein [Halalkalibacterium halodurans]